MSLHADLDYLRGYASSSCPDSPTAVVPRQSIALRYQVAYDAKHLVSAARRKARASLEWAGLPLLYGGLWVARWYRPSFHRTSPHVYSVADRLGVYPVIDHYHDPPVRYAPDSHSRDRRLPGIDMRVDGQLDLLEHLRFGQELSLIPRKWRPTASPYYDNQSFAPADAAIYHSLIRHFRPRRVIEIGAGESTRFAAHALALNAAEGNPAELVAIEPFEAPYLEELGVTVIRERVEDVGTEFFAGLQANDFVFIDSSHVARPGGDVAFLLLEVVPALARGVVLHIHDVFTPRDYPAEWGRRRWFWTEQYVVEALLTYNANLEVLLSVSFMLERYPREFGFACPVPAARGGGPTPSSIWLRTTEGLGPER